MTLSTTPAPQQPVLDRSPMSLGDALGSTFRAFGRGLGLLFQVAVAQFGAVLGIVVASVVLFFLVSGAPATSDRIADHVAQRAGAAAAAFLFAFALLIVASLWFASLQAAVVDQVARGFDPTWRSIREQVRGVVARGLVLLLLPFGLVLAIVFLVLLAGWLSDTEAPGFWLPIVVMLALGLAAIVLSIRWAFTLQALALEQRGGLDALRRSWQLTRDRFWPILGSLLVVNFLADIIPRAVSQAVDLDRMGGVGMSVVGFSLLVLTVGSSIFQSAFTTILYIDHVQRHALGTTPLSPFSGPGSWQPVAPVTPYPVRQALAPGAWPQSYPMAPQQPGYPVPNQGAGNQSWPGQQWDGGQQWEGGQQWDGGQQPWGTQPQWPGEQGAPAPQSWPGSQPASYPQQTWPSQQPADPSLSQQPPTAQPPRDTAHPIPEPVAWPDEVPISSASQRTPGTPWPGQPQQQPWTASTDQRPDDGRQPEDPDDSPWRRPTS